MVRPPGRGPSSGSPDSSPLELDKDGRSWRIGAQADVAWINDSFRLGVEIETAIPPVFDAYATVMVPDQDEGRSENLGLLVRLLRAHSGEQQWWLGYLDTGADGVVFPDAPRVRAYADWPYVLVLAGPDEALRWGQEDRAWHGPGPDLVFPVDHSWLLTWLWDDSWRCVGGSRALIDAIVGSEELDARSVQRGEDATPPGHEAI